VAGSSPAMRAARTDPHATAPAPDLPVDLEKEQQERILQLHESLPTLDHYALLGVPRGADKKTIKRAYYELATTFHPDRFFRKNLGPFKSKMEAIFGKMTAAFEVLTHSVKRKDYDAAMGIVAVAVTAPPPDAHHGGRPTPSPSSHDSIPISRRPTPPPKFSQTPEAPTKQSHSTLADKAPSERPTMAAPRIGSDPPGQDRAQRDALARRLLGSRAPQARNSMGPRSTPSQPPPSVVMPPSSRMSAFPTAAPPPSATQQPPMSATRIPAMPPAPHIRSSLVPPSGPPSSVPPSSSMPRSDPPGSQMTADAMDALRRRYSERMGKERGAQVKKYIDMANEALSKNDPVAAANALRIALSITPEDSALRAQLSMVEISSAKTLIESNLRQISKDEERGDWGGAARTWAKVLLAKPDDPAYLDRAATAIMKAGGNLREAAEHARKACELSPKNPGYRITLARVYIGAALFLNAKRELEFADQLSPGNDTIRSLLKDVRSKI
jgi:curved DNA-binding protein CbpA/Flp pilus assembly protein TadD